MTPHSPSCLTVSAAEEGMKLLRFLERRLAELPAKNALHKWIRTGQVRVNSGRAKPFTLLNAGDIVRIPPFALPRSLESAGSSAQESPLLSAHSTAETPENAAVSPLPFLGCDLAVVAATDDILVMGKSGGLAVQPGNGQADSVSQRLQKAYEGHAFIPAPVHRLDRHTSGVLLAGRNHKTQRYLHDLFRNPGAIQKDYLAWVAGKWEPETPCLLADTLEKQQDTTGREAVCALSDGFTLPLSASGNMQEFDFSRAAASGERASARAPNAFCVVQRVSYLDAKAIPAFLHRESAHLLRKKNAGAHEGNGPSQKGASLLLVRLLTGKTHQIRVQLASRGFCILGDGRYGGVSFPVMLLHAYGVSLPERVTGEPLSFHALPQWQAPFMPSADTLDHAENTLGASLVGGAYENVFP